MRHQVEVVRDEGMSGTTLLAERPGGRRIADLFDARRPTPGGGGCGRGRGPHGRAMAQIGAVFAELERSLIAERTAEALTELRQQGRAWNHAPFGWDAVDGRLVANATEQITLNRLRDLRASGTSYHKVAAILDGEGRATKRGGPWQAASVCSVLRTAAQLVKTSAA